MVLLVEDSTGNVAQHTSTTTNITASRVVEIMWAWAPWSPIALRQIAAQGGFDVAAEQRTLVQTQCVQRYDRHGEFLARLRGVVWG